MIFINNFAPRVNLINLMVNMPLRSRISSEFSVTLYLQKVLLILICLVCFKSFRPGRLFLISSSFFLEDFLNLSQPGNYFFTLFIKKGYLVLK